MRKNKFKLMIATIVIIAICLISYFNLQSVRIVKQLNKSSKQIIYANNYNGEKYTLLEKIGATTYCTVNFNANGGNVSESSRIVVKGSKIGELPVPTKRGYVFKGWYTSLTNGTKITQSTIIEKNTNCYAIWEKEKYTVTFDSNGGRPATIIRTVEYATTLGTLPIVTREGFDFEGWYSSREGGYRITSYDTVNEDTTFYAHWSDINEVVEYKVKHYLMDQNGTSYQLKIIESKSGIANTEDTPDVMEFEGFTPPSPQTVVINRDGSTVVEYRYQRNKYRFTLGEHVGADTTGSTGTKDIYYENVVVLRATEKVGYSFKSWNSSDTSLVNNITQSIAEFEMPAGNIKMTPNMEPVEYPIEYTLYGGNNNSSNPKKYNIETETFYLKNPTRNGYSFIGWTGSNGSTPQKNVAINKGSYGVKSFIANWEETTTPVINYTITFNPNGGTVLENTRTVEEGQPIGTLPMASRDGYIFMGWYTSATGGSKISSTTTISSNITFYAHWNEIDKTKYIVTFDGNGGNVSERNRQIEEGNIIGTLPTATREGYIFEGWYTAINGGNLITITTVINSDVTFYAHWKKSITEANYTVKHFLMDKSGTTYELRDTEVFTGNIGENVTPKVKSYPGFTSPEEQIVSITEDGLTEIIYRYTRNKYSFKLESNKGIDTSGSTENGNIYFETEVKIRASEKNGYKFDKWTIIKNSNIENTTNKNFSFNMPNENVTIQPSVELINYTITYILNGGNVESNYTV